MNIALGIDVDGAIGERVAAEFFDSGHEIEEGVFHLLPFDLWAKVELAGSRLIVRLVAWPDRIEQVMTHADGAHPAPQRPDHPARPGRRMHRERDPRRRRRLTVIGTVWHGVARLTPPAWRR